MSKLIRFLILFCWLIAKTT